MIHKITSKNYSFFFLFFFLFLSFLGNAQIGIGTITPNVSSVLDVTSTTQGLLTPRMTTAQRNAITTPADGLMVYDTTLKSFYHYVSTTSTWTVMSNGNSQRLNFKRIKSTDVLAVVLATELAAGGGAKYLLNSATLYEINGTVIFNLPIDLNNAYIEGLDANDDIIVRSSGVLFEGTTGGSVRSVTISATGATVFNLNAAATTSNFLMRDTIIAGATSVGTISGYGLVFMSIVNFIGNSNGITYNNIGQLLLSNQAWLAGNLGTYEKFTGTFTLIEKQGGFSQVNGTAIGLDVSTAGLTITGDAVLESVVFTGNTTAGFVKPYTTGTYTGFNFNNSWTVRAAGIPTEGDANAVGDFSMDYAVGGFLPINFQNNTDIIKIGINGTSPAPPTVNSNLFRFTNDSPSFNRLKYIGKKKRIFQIVGSVSFQVPAAGTYIIYIAKNGSTLSQFKIYGRGTTASDIVVLPLNATTELQTNDYIEVFAQRYSGSNGNVLVTNMTVSIK